MHCPVVLRAVVVLIHLKDIHHIPKQTPTENAKVTRATIVMYLVDLMTLLKTGYILIIDQYPFPLKPGYILVSLR